MTPITRWAAVSVVDCKEDAKAIRAVSRSDADNLCSSHLPQILYELDDINPLASSELKLRLPDLQKVSRILGLGKQAGLGHVPNEIGALVREQKVGRVEGHE